ncbi:MAG: integrase arm-type DNA-binding domain-containing protein [Chitinophagaceae bacterium]
MPLSDRQCHAAKPKHKPYKLSDFEGLYLEVVPTGAKYWRLKYRYGGKEKRLFIGIYPDVTLQQARQEKLAAKETIACGIDPVLAKRERQQTAKLSSLQTFKETALEWHSKQVECWKPRYAKTISHRLEKYLFPEIGDYPLQTIKPLTILSCLQKVEKTAPDMTRRLKQYCKQIFIYAIATGHIEKDPSYGLEHALKKYKKGHFASIDVDQLPKFLIDMHEFRSRLNRQTYLAIRLLFLTFVRTSELIECKWSEIDFDKSLWTIPSERIKMSRPHLVPLSRQAIEILNELKELNGNREFVLPSLPYPQKPMSNGTILVALKRMGYRNKMTGHGFRALAMGILKEKLGYTHELVDRQLSHARKSGNDRAYDRALFLPQRTEMMQRYADYLDEVYLMELKSKLAKQ